MSDTKSKYMLTDDERAADVDSFRGGAGVQSQSDWLAYKAENTATFGPEDQQRAERYRNPTTFLRDWKRKVEQVRMLNGTQDAARLLDATKELAELEGYGDAYNHFGVLESTARLAASAPNALTEGGLLTIRTAHSLMPGEVKKSLDKNGSAWRDVSNPGSILHQSAKLGLQYSSPIVKARAARANGEADEGQNRLAGMADTFVAAGFTGEALQQGVDQANGIAGNALAAVASAAPRDPETRDAWSRNLSPVLLDVSSKLVATGRAMPEKAPAAIVSYFADDPAGQAKAASAIRELGSLEPDVPTQYFDKALSGPIRPGLTGTQLVNGAKAGARALAVVDQALAGGGSAEARGHLERVALVESGVSPQDEEYRTSLAYAQGRAATVQKVVASMNEGDPRSVAESGLALMALDGTLERNVVAASGASDVGAQVAVRGDAQAVVWSQTPAGQNITQNMRARTTGVVVSPERVASTAASAQLGQDAVVAETQIRQAKAAMESYRGAPVAKEGEIPVGEGAFLPNAAGDTRDVRYQLLDLQFPAVAEPKTEDELRRFAARRTAEENLESRRLTGSGMVGSIKVGVTKTPRIPRYSNGVGTASDPGTSDPAFLSNYDRFTKGAFVVDGVSVPAAFMVRNVQEFARLASAQEPSDRAAILAEFRERAYRDGVFTIQEDGKLATRATVTSPKQPVTLVPYRVPGTQITDTMDPSDPDSILRFNVAHEYIMDGVPGDEAYRAALSEARGLLEQVNRVEESTTRVVQRLQGTVASEDVYQRAVSEDALMHAVLGNKYVAGSVLRGQAQKAQRVYAAEVHKRRVDLLRIKIAEDKNAGASGNKELDKAVQLWNNAIKLSTVDGVVDVVQARAIMSQTPGALELLRERYEVAESDVDSDTE